jgi:hypothetical protein
MSHLLLALSKRDVFNPTVSPSFNLPSFLSIKTIVLYCSALTPSTLFKHTTLALFIEHPTSHYQLLLHLMCLLCRLDKVHR